MGAARAGPEQLQVSVLEWTLADVRAEWASPAWQAHLASPEAFIQQYTHASPDGAGGWQVRLPHPSGAAAEAGQGFRERLRGLHS